MVNFGMLSANRRFSDGPEPPEPRSVQSIVVGFTLIEALLSSPEPMSLKDLSAAAGMSSGKAHAYLASFRSVGLVRQEENGRYALGPYALTLGLAALSRLDVREAASGPMRAFRDEMKCGIHLAVWSGEDPIIVSRLDGTAAPPVTIRIGAALPLDISATGRVFLAFLPDARRRLDTASGLSVEPESRERIAEETRRRGLARTDSLLHVGLFGLSAPVFDHEGQLAGALTAVGPSADFETDWEGRTATALVAAATATSEAMGYQPTAHTE